MLIGVIYSCFLMRMPTALAYFDKIQVHLTNTLIQFQNTKT